MRSLGPKKARAQIAAPRWDFRKGRKLHPFPVGFLMRLPLLFHRCAALRAEARFGIELCAAFCAKRRSRRLRCGRFGLLCPTLWAKPHARRILRTACTSPFGLILRLGLGFGLFRSALRAEPHAFRVLRTACARPFGLVLRLGLFCPAHAAEPHALWILGAACSRPACRLLLHLLLVGL